MRDRTDSEISRRRWALGALTSLALSRAIFPSFWEGVNKFYDIGLPAQVQLPSPKEIKRADEQLAVDGLYDDNSEIYLVSGRDNDFR